MDQTSRDMESKQAKQIETNRTIAMVITCDSRLTPAFASLSAIECVS